MKIYNIGIKLIAIFWVAMGASSLPSVFLVFNGTEFSLTYILTLVHPLFVIFVGMVLFFLSDKIATLSDVKNEGNEKEPFKFSSAIQLIGIYILANSTAEIIGYSTFRLLSEFSENQEMFADMKLYTNLFLALIGFIFIFRARDITTRLTRYM